MKITRVLNNNVVAAKDEEMQDVIVMGKGVGFDRRRGDAPDPGKVERVFALADRDQYQNFKSLVQSIEPQAIELGEDIIAHAAARYPGKIFAPIIHISLNDHISGVIERQKRGLTLDNAIWTEVRRIYPDEFEIGRYAVRKMNEKLGYALGNDEAAFIAVHFVNAQGQGTAPDVERVARLINDIVVLVKSFFAFEPDEGSVDYYRFVEHIKIMSQCAFGLEEITEEDNGLYEFVAAKYPDIAACVSKVERLIAMKYRGRIGRDDEAYLILYIQRLMRK